MVQGNKGMSKHLNYFSFRIEESSLSASMQFISGIYGDYQDEAEWSILIISLTNQNGCII